MSSTNRARRQAKRDRRDRKRDRAYWDHARATQPWTRIADLPGVTVEPARPAAPPPVEPGAERELRMGMASALAVDAAGLTGSPSSDVAAWLDARGLPYSWTDPNETGDERLRRLFG